MHNTGSPASRTDRIQAQCTRAIKDIALPPPPHTPPEWLVVLENGLLCYFIAMLISVSICHLPPVWYNDKKADHLSGLFVQSFRTRV